MPIDPNDLIVEVCPDTKVGGQQVSIVTATVKVTHKPSSISVTIGIHRSQLKNKRVAIEMIEWALASR